MPHSPEEKKKVLTRVRRIRGQCDALERALLAGEDCAPVLQQIAAIRGAVNGLMSQAVGLGCTQGSLNLNGHCGSMLPQRLREPTE